MADRIDATQDALDLIAKLEGMHGPLMFFQGSGCCEGSSPMCYLRGELKLGARDILLGNVGGQPFYIGANEFEYVRHSHLTLDVVEGSGAGFSLEAPEKLSFLTRSRLFTDAEAAELAEMPALNAEGEPYKAPATP